MSMYPLTVGIAISSAELWDVVQKELRQLPVRVVMEMSSLDDPVGFLEKVDRFRPDALLLDPSGFPGEMTELLAQLRKPASSSQVVLVRDRPDPDEILAALHAGAREYLYPPIGPKLAAALERISAERTEHKARSSGSEGKVVGFVSAKGGCGATTLACHFALDIARLTQKETLLADLDFACGSVRILMQSRSRYSLIDAVNNIQRLDESYWRGLVTNGHAGLEVIASTPADAGWRMPQPGELRQVIRFMRQQYPWTVADLGHGLGPLTASALEEIDTLVLVATPEVPALHHAKLMGRFVQAAGFPRAELRLVLNRVSGKGDLSREDIESALGHPVFASIPNDYRRLNRAYSQGQLLDEGSSLRQSITTMAAKVANVQAEERRRRLRLFG